MSDDSGLSGSIDGPTTLRGAVALLLVGLAMTGYGVYDFFEQNEEIQDSVTVEATIVQNEVVQRSSSSPNTADIDYAPELQYEYDYEGTRYTGSSIYPSETVTLEYDTREAARSEVSEYENGSTVTARVLPSNPSESFLRAQRSYQPLAVAGVGLLLSLFCGWRARSLSRQR
jgi:hypothetical protein